MITNEQFHAPLSSHGRPGARIPGQDRSQVEHLCPECGGASTADLGNTLLVQLCKACHGRGLMTDEELSAYLRMLNDPHNQ
jgi:DnaJ-class molecular chaperone